MEDLETGGVGEPFLYLAFLAETRKRLSWIWMEHMRWRGVWAVVPKRGRLRTASYRSWRENLRRDRRVGWHSHWLEGIIFGVWAGYVQWVIIYGVSPDNAGRVLFRADGLHSNSGSAGIGGQWLSEQGFCPNRNVQRKGHPRSYYGFSTWVV